MARPGLHFSAEQQQQIVDAIQRLDIAFPHDNAVFLDEVIEAVQAVTRRIYGVRRYVQWLTEAGVRRRPSNTTLQKAVD
ncbi:MAG: DNA-binding protein, partial [Ralstonia sp.]|nr:DNA-binding protein [Ralstonia sp.]MBA4294461.1 DNA-binding protein [Ralstonia sp.]